MEVHPQAPTNPLYQELTDYVDGQRQLPTEFRRAGKLRHIDISEHNEKVIKESLLDIQNTCLPTLNKLRSQQNVIQLQERVYQKLLPHVDVLNICILKSRTVVQADYCFQVYQRNFEAQFKPTLKDILLDY